MLLVAAAFVASSLHVQVDTTAGIHGAVLSSFNGQPIAGVMVAALGGQKFTLSDEHGRFELTGLPTGRRAILISYDGRVTEDFLFSLEPQHSKRIAVLLDQDAEDLDPLVVEARAANLWRDLAGFYERRETYRGFAHFFTREEIGHLHAAKLSSLLTLEGIVMRCSVECRPTRLNRGSLCLVPVSVNGVAQREPDFDRIDIADVAGVEVYRGVPPADLARSMLAETRTSTWMGTGRSAGGGCGLVEIWTR